MRSFFDWYEESQAPDDRPWLILGKGPSFEHRFAHDLDEYRLLSLNHAVRDQPVLVAHAVDLDVVDLCSESLDENAQVVVLPWHPHVACVPSERTLEDWLAESETLRRLDQRGALLWYNLSTAPGPRPGSPVVRVRFFSAEAALNLLVTAGARRVRSLGVDGGAAYSREFEDLTGKTLLVNTRTTFDEQFQEIARTIMETNVDFAPLDVESPIRIYVATTEAQMLAVQVLDYSIRRHASMTTRVFPLHRADIPIPTPEMIENQARTPFSFQRFLIPQLAGYQGRAIYLDSDMLVFDDIKKLWTLPFDGADLLAVRDPEESARRPQFSVMLLDCKALRWDVRELVERLDCGELTYEELMYDMVVAERIRATIPPAWNSLEKYRPGETALLHYTDMNTQPWIYIDHPLGHLWMDSLFQMLDDGFLSLDEVREHIEAGYVRPSLLWQIENRVDDGRLLPREARLLDQRFIPPYQSLPTVRLNRWSRPRQFLSAALRASPLPSLARRLRRSASR